MPSPVPTYERILTFLHQERDSCDGSVKAVRRGWRFWKFDYICQKCGCDLLPEVDCPFTRKRCIPSCRLFGGGKCLHETATRGVIESEKKMKEMMSNPTFPQGGRVLTLDELPPEALEMIRTVLERIKKSDGDDDYQA